MLRFKRKSSYIFAVLITALLTLLLWMVISPVFEVGQRRSSAEKFLEALKKQELTVNNAIVVSKKYKIDLVALLRNDIYFPIALVDYEFLSEESVPRGLVTSSVEEWRELLGENSDRAERAFNALKEELKRKKPKNLEIDEANKTLRYYDDSPSSYKLHYLLTVTNALGMSLKKNGYIRIKKDLIGRESLIGNKYVIVEFKY